MIQKLTAQQAIFAPLPLTRVENTAKATLTYAPDDWVSGVYRSDVFEFNTEVEECERR